MSWEEEGEEEESIGYLFVIFVVNLDNLTEIHLIDVVELSLLNARIHVVELSVAHRGKKSRQWKCAKRGDLRIEVPEPLRR